MRHLITPALLACALATSPAFAADGGQKGPKGKLERMTRELNLSPDQQGKVKAILEAEHARKEALKEETHGKLKAVLTKEQYARFEHK